ncbi:helix-turn-helix domain-containing protein [Nocardia sp. SYP-A9097]|uniref:helix-turn-helix transcriptional regulator n=1 Tax=Nocardia sp. SYP-A9097 TaxID=2663237 RepID=UPI00132581CB|nr:helix-turn-helix transcriptional regulator [Nocardia sp. SYP-A9097]MRH87044.1 helix-turn-helix domain-containing protein [Nocardia sp. SYP-A9097]
MNRDELADFLRRHREALQPAAVGLPPGARRRTPGLRRDEVAMLAGMSTDYYTRLEQARGPRPSTQVLAALARALRFTDNERDHLYHLAGQQPPARGGDTHVGPGILHVLTKLDDTPACVISDLGEVLVQNRMHTLVSGDFSQRRGLDRCIPWLWFTAPHDRERFLPEDRDGLARHHVAGLRATAAARSGDADVTDLVARLRSASTEFEALWSEHEVRAHAGHNKRMLHPEVGLLELVCEPLLTPSATRQLLIYYPKSGTDTQEKLDLLRVIGTQSLTL